MLQEHNSLVVEGIQRGNPFRQTFELFAPYSLTQNAIYAVTDSQHLQWVEFNPMSLTVEVKRANALRQNHLVIVQYQEELGPEIMFNEARHMATRSILYGVSVALCDQAHDQPEAPFASMDDMRQNIMKQADTMYTAFSKKHYDEFLSYFPSELVTQLGGLQHTIQLISQDPLEGKGTIITRNIASVSDIIEEEHALAAFVTVTTTYDFAGQEYLQQTYMIALSKDNGRHWVFYSSQGKPEQENHYKTKFPHLTEVLSYPETFLRKK